MSQTRGLPSVLSTCQTALVIWGTGEDAGSDLGVRLIAAGAGAVLSWGGREVGGEAWVSCFLAFSVLLTHLRLA